MPERKVKPLKQAAIDVPKRFYEITNARLFYAGTVLASAAGGVTAIEVFHEKPYVHAAIGGTIYLASTIADRISTTKVFQISQELRKRGIKTGVKESNPFFNKKLKVEKMTPRQFNTLPEWIAYDAAGVAASAADIGIAIPFSLSRLYATVNNLRLARRYKRAIEIYDSQHAA